MVPHHVSYANRVLQCGDVVSMQECLVAGLKMTPVFGAHAAVGRQDVEDVAAVHVVEFPRGDGVALKGGEDSVGERQRDAEELVFAL